MGIFRAGVRVTRALTPAPSSSSSDDDEARIKKKFKGTKNSEKAPKVRLVEHVTKDTSELSQFGDSTCHLPEELFELLDLTDVLSLESWNDCLSERERQHLCAYLPDMDQGSFNKTLKELFSSQNMCFGSPLEDLWQRLKGGLCDPNVLKSSQTLISLQRREYYHDLRLYHNRMLNSIREMQEVWASNPEASHEERISSWRKWKSLEAHNGCLNASNDGTKTDSLSVPAAVADDHLLKSGKAESDSKHASNSNDEESAWHSDLEMGQVVERRRTQPRTFTEERVQSFVDVDFPETSSKRKVDRDLTIQGPNRKRKSTSQGGPEHRAKQSSYVNGYSSKHSRALVSPHHEDIHLSKTWPDGYMDSAPKASEVMVREPSSCVLSKACHKVENHKVEKRVPSSFCQDRVQVSAIRPAKLGDFVPPATPGFTFSILHFLSAVRASLVESGVECLPFRGIVSIVDSCPGDLRVLQLQWPLDCLVRGALKVLVSTEKNLAINGFKPLASYDKAIRCWSWIGPVPGTVCTFREIDLHSMSEVWSIPSGVLGDLQIMFGNWLKNTEKTLQQLWELAQVPLPVFPVFPVQKERFKELRAQKSLTTVSTSSYEMRALFQREERVRYSAVEIAFRYTTGDGQKSAVAPLRKLGGRCKPKARDHFMLRSDRPSHITILCLVRDAAARLPQGIGTRADVCILLRDSQYIEDVSELQLSHVVSGALDRLHYERDPCVRYDQDKKLWLYLHGDREEEDFDEGGTTSTRSSRRSKKDGAFPAVSPAQRHDLNDDDMSEPEPDSGSFNSNGGASESASPDLLYEQHQKGGSPALVLENVGGLVREEVLLQFYDLPASMQPLCGPRQSHPMGWEVYKAGKELSITH